MYLRTKHAAVWTDGGLPEPVPSARRHSPKVATLWASRPFAGRLGRYVAIRLRDGEVSVAVAGNPMMWVPARRAMTEKEAEHWARQGFGPEQSAPGR